MKEIYGKAFGLVLRDLRLDKGLSQENLAFESNLDRTYISLLERGLRQPTIKTLFLLAKALQIEPHKIIALIELRIA